MALNPLTKKKKIWLLAACGALVVLVALPFILGGGSNRLRADFTVIGRKTVVQSVSATGQYGLGAQEKRTLAAFGQAEEGLLGKQVRKGDVLLRGTDGETVRAPFDGYVTAVQEGNPAAVTVAEKQTDRLVLLAEEAVRAQLKAGQRVTLSADGKCTGTVASVGDCVVSDGKNSGIPVTVTLTKEMAALLEQTAVPGAEITGKICLAEAENALYLPKKAVRFDENGNPYCYTVDDGHRAKRVYPVLGIAGEDAYEIISGLTADTSVVLTIPAGIREDIVVLPNYTDAQ